MVALVIDTCILQGAGKEDTNSLDGKACRDFLETVLDTENPVVLTPQLEDEWNAKDVDDYQKGRFASRYARG